MRHTGREPRAGFRRHHTASERVNAYGAAVAAMEKAALWRMAKGARERRVKARHATP